MRDAHEVMHAHDDLARRRNRGRRRCRVAELRISVSALIESLIREGFAPTRAGAEGPSLPFVTVGRGHVLPGVDLDRAAKLIDDADEAGGPAKMGADLLC